METGGVRSAQSLIAKLPEQAGSANRLLPRADIPRPPARRKSMTGVTPGNSVGSIQPYAGRPAPLRSASIRARPRVVVERHAHLDRPVHVRGGASLQRCDCSAQFHHVHRPDAGEIHPRRADRRRSQRRAGAELTPHLLPARPTVAVHVQRQRRILPTSEVPRIVGRAVAVHVPRRIQAGVERRRQQRPPSAGPGPPIRPRPISPIPIPTLGRDSAVPDTRRPVARLSEAAA